MAKATTDEPCNCYLHGVEDPNEVHFDPEIHTLCLLCAVKVWELASEGFEFEMRDAVVSMSLRPLSDDQEDENAND
jgi:hypothetical protein